MDPVPSIGRSVSIDHAAELLGVSRRTIYNRIREGRLQTVRTIGGSQRVTLESVADLGGRLPESFASSADKEKSSKKFVASAVLTLLVLGVSVAPASAQRARLSEDLADHLASGSQTIDVILGADQDAAAFARKYNLRIKKTLRSGGAVVEMNASQLAV